jgi:hypothetical protein
VAIGGRLDGMTEADGSVNPGARPGWRWDVALSFAGARRDYVDQVAQALKARGVRCFYDADEEIELWGKYLAEELPAIYGEQAAAVVIFVSAEYASRDWTRHERRAALGRAVRERREYVLPARFDDTLLPGLLPDVSYVDLRGRTPQHFAAMIAAKLANLGIGPSSSPGGSDKGPPGGIPVSKADPRRLGVHAAISVPGMSDDVPPEYVPRDVDAAEHGVRAKVAAAAQRGGFVLLVGGSSVGKTRSAAEAVKVLLPDWWLVHPAGPRDVAARAQTPLPRTVMWLDELQRYLGGEHGLTGAVLRELLSSPHPTVIIGTLWPDLYTTYTTYTTVPASGGVDMYAREREVLDLAAVVRIDPAFSRAEQDRARAASGRDPRLAIALGAADYGLTQTLAAAPQLVARWEDARIASPYGCAVLTAALDVTRLGARAPLSAALLRAAAPGYCTSQQQAVAPDDWFEQALTYATGKLHGAVVALIPAGAGMGRVVGYTVADYLLQHASRERRYARVPASTWDAVLTHLDNPADAARLAYSAMNRLLYGYAIPLYRHAADAGDGDAALWLADLLAGRGDLEGATLVLRARADAGDEAAGRRLADLLIRRGYLHSAVQILHAAADVGDQTAASELAGLLASHGDVRGLRTRADAGDRIAARRLADLLIQRGDLGELRARADAGDGFAVLELTRLMARRGDVDGAVQMLRARADADGTAALELAYLLAGKGDMESAIEILRARADVGDEDAAFQLAGVLGQRGDLDGLRARADAGDGFAVLELARLLVDCGDLDGAVQILRVRADAGDEGAAFQLAGVLGQRGDLDGLRARADVGDRAAASRLADLLAERGDKEELRARADAGDWSAATELAGLLIKHGDLEGLRARVDAGDRAAARQLASLLAKRLIKQGLGEEAQRLRMYGLNLDGSVACA